MSRFWACIVFSVYYFVCIVQCECGNVTFWILYHEGYITPRIYNIYLYLTTMKLRCIKNAATTRSLEIGLRRSTVHSVYSTLVWQILTIMTLAHTNTQTHTHRAASLDSPHRLLLLLLSSLTHAERCVCSRAALGRCPAERDSDLAHFKSPSFEGGRGEWGARGFYAL